MLPDTTHREEALRADLDLDPARWAPLRHRAREVFDGLPVAGRRVLDVGAGIGIYSLYLRRVGGARQVVALEPSAGIGGHSDIADRLRKMVASAGEDAVEIVESTFQTYTPDEPFDVIVLLNSINHMHETEAPLEDDPEALAAFAKVFATLREWLVPGGDLLINELHRFCLERYTTKVGIPPVFTQKINYNLHQRPSIWANLAREAGFVDVRWRGVTPRRMAPLGRLGRRAPVGFLTNAMFVMNARRDA